MVADTGSMVELCATYRAARLGARGNDACILRIGESDVAHKVASSRAGGGEGYEVESARSPTRARNMCGVQRDPRKGPREAGRRPRYGGVSLRQAAHVGEAPLGRRREEE